LVIPLRLLWVLCASAVNEHYAIRTLITDKNLAKNIPNQMQAALEGYKTIP
jgi:hypothetical protein